MGHYAKARDLAVQAHFPAGAFGAQRGVALCALLLGREKEFRAAIDDLFKRDPDIDRSTLVEIWTDVAVDALRRKQIDEADHAAQEAMTRARDVSEDFVKAETYQVMASVRIAQKRWAEAIDDAQRAIG